MTTEIAKISDWQHRFAEWLIANPDKSLSEASKVFDRSVPWLSTVRNSDAFQDFFKKLSAEYSGAILHSVREKTLGLADRAVTKLQEKLELEGDSLPVKSLVEIADLALKRTGHGEGGAATAAPVNINIGVVDSQILREARERMRAVQSSTRVLELHAESSVELSEANAGGSS